MSQAVATAARYMPTPNTACVTRLLPALKTGRAVRLDATPAPIAGCSTNHGAATVTSPNCSEGHSDGERAQSSP